MSDSPDASLVGRRLGVYKVLALLGAGGMGEVYRARDTRLGRDVALKVLPNEFSDHPDRLARFEREARALAALNHPHIATIYGVEDVDLPIAPGAPAPVYALVLELIEGDTLAARIYGSVGRQRGIGLPIDDAVTIARQIAEALDAAHEKGIIHRDLKPANIKITPEGLVKVLDFGIAKLPPGGARDAEGPDQSTITVAGTREGLIIGTAAYMSPEQARGHTIDKRTDVWAFGCVVYEMLSGRAAFARETITDTLAAVLESEPDWRALPDTTPPGLRRLVRRCLVKDLRHRLRDIGDARLELADVLTTVDADSITAPSGSAQASHRWRHIVVGAGLVGLVAAGALLWTSSRPAVEPTSPALTRTTITLPSGQELDTRGGAGPLAIAPDGRRIAYVADVGGSSQLYIRSMDAFEPKPIAGTEGAQYPFFSTDGEWVAFFAAGKLKRVAVRGGSPLTICDAPIVGRGAAWGPDGTIVFDPGNAGLLRVAATGGAPEPLTTRDKTIDNANLSWPQFLPNGRGLLATVGMGGGATSVLAVLSLETREWRRLGPGSQAQYLPSGHLLYHASAVQRASCRLCRSMRSR